MQLWLSADVGVYSDAGTTLAVDAATVQQWNDKSANASNFSQATAGNRPAFKTAIINNQPVLRFTGASNNYVFRADTATLDLTGDQSFFLVVKGSDTAAVLIQHYDTGGAFAGWGVGLGIGPNNGKLSYWSEGKGSWFNDTGSAASDGNAHVLTVTRTSGTVAFFFDGTASITQTGHGNAASTDQIDIGIDSGEAGSSYNGDLAEIIVYNVAVTTAQRVSIERYLGAKYAVTVA